MCIVLTYEYTVAYWDIFRQKLLTTLQNLHAHASCVKFSLDINLVQHK